jgi:hypothetical protein
MSTNSVSSSNQGVSYVNNAMNGIDFSKYPELAQKLALINQARLSLIESKVLTTSQEAQGAFLTGSIEGGFDSAFDTAAFGAAEAGMGVMQMGAAGYQVKAAGENIAGIHTLEGNKDADFEKFESQNTAQNNSIVPHNVDAPVPGASAPIPLEGGQGAILHADEAGEPDTSLKGKIGSRKEILSKYELELEKVRAENNRQSNGFGQMLQTSAQLGQLPAQALQATSGTNQTKQQVMNNNYSTVQSAGQTALQTAQKAQEFDPYAQNVASSRG